MYKIGDFRIVTDNECFRIVDKRGNVIKKFSINKYEKKCVRAWREGYVHGMNYRVYT